MGFPIKKRIGNDASNGDSGGLDLLLAATSIASQENEQERSSENNNCCNPTWLHSQLSPQEASEQLFAGNKNENAIGFYRSTPVSESRSDAEDSYNDESISNTKTKTFPEILMDMLSCTEYSSIISWLPHGRSFIIHKPRKFASKVLPKYIRRTRFDSFIRKLNRWGFRRIKSNNPSERSSFAHRYFLRDSPEQCAKMQCASKPVQSFSQRRGTLEGVRSTLQVMEPYGLSSNTINSFPTDDTQDQRKTNISFPDPNKKDVDASNSVGDQHDSQSLLQQIQDQMKLRSRLLEQMPLMDADVTSQILAQRHLQLSLMTQQTRALLRSNGLM